MESMTEQEYDRRRFELICAFIASRDLLEIAIKQADRAMKVLGYDEEAKLSEEG